MPTVALHTLGCRTNQAELDRMRRALAATGETVDFVSWDEVADVYVLHTCTVTARADRQCRQRIHQARRRAPGARIVVTGCYAEMARGTLEAIEGVSAVLGMEERGRVVEEVLGEARAAEGTRILEERPARARALLKIQEGCDSRCAYCVVPMARGRSRSRGLGEVMGEARELAGEGYPEIVVCGTHIGRWGADLGESGALVDLVGRLLDEVRGPRLRLSSLDPHELTGDLLALIASEERICRHLHLSLQHTSDRVLRAMNRPRGGLETVWAAAEAVPGIGLGADVICGFPGEDDEDFASLRSQLGEAPLAYLHVFGFSPRPGTVAATLPGGVPSQERARRVTELRELSENRLRPAFLQTLVGETVEVVVEGRRDQRLRGISSQYAAVEFEGPDDVLGQSVRVAVTSWEGDRLQGMLL
jgi:threonylcarbamoyladenosine tRNA methylthiotransferase MtaB